MLNAKQFKQFFRILLLLFTVTFLIQPKRSEAALSMLNPAMTIAGAALLTTGVLGPILAPLGCIASEPCVQFNRNWGVLTVVTITLPIGLLSTIIGIILLEDGTQALEFPNNLTIQESQLLGLGSDLRRIQIFNSKRALYNVMAQDVAKGLNHLQNPTPAEVRQLWREQAENVDLRADEKQALADVSNGILEFAVQNATRRN